MAATIGVVMSYLSQMSDSGPRVLARELHACPFPAQDGWGWLYRAFERVARPGGRARRAICTYFFPWTWERWGGGRIYRWLGVHLFGAIIPTGGIVIRRAFRARMAPYTLAGISIRAARDFYYKTCVFEALHMPFFLTLVGLAIHRASIGRIDYAIENTVVNLLVNLYPMMHHRRTRTRIVRLLQGRMGEGTGAADLRS